MSKGQWVKVGFVVFLELIMGYSWLTSYYLDSLFTWIFTLGISCFVLLILLHNYPKLFCLNSGHTFG